MSTNTRNRKSAKEYARGFTAGEENRIFHADQWQRHTDAYDKGFRAGMAARERHFKEKQAVFNAFNESGYGELQQ